MCLKHNIIFVISLCTLITHPGYAQVDQDSSFRKSKSVEDTSFVMRKSPGGAALRSAILPGLGQFYNESYWKIPIIFCIGGYLIYGYISNNNLFTRYRDEYAASVGADSPSGDLNIKLYREFYRDQRDTYAWFFGLLYLIQIADAFVDAHLFDFSVENGSHASLMFTGPAQLTFQIRW